MFGDDGDSSDSDGDLLGCYHTRLHRVHYDESFVYTWRMVCKDCSVLHCPWGPALEFRNGNTEWRNDGERHRADGPAVITHDVESWFLYGQRHCLTGPAVRRRTGSEGQGALEDWWVDGRRITSETHDEAVRHYCTMNPRCPSVLYLQAQQLSLRKIKAARVLPKAARVSPDAADLN